MRKTTIVAFVAISFIFPCLISFASEEDQMAVESIGEVNAKDNSTGTVIAGTTADLIVTLIADMSQAEPGEEIASIQITIPSGFSARENAVTALTVGAVFMLRHRRPDLARPYRAWGYPLTPALYVAVALGMMIFAVFTRPLESLIGVGIVVLGVPVYLFWSREKSRIE